MSKKIHFSYIFLILGFSLFSSLATFYILRNNKSFFVCPCKPNQETPNDTVKKAPEGYYNQYSFDTLSKRNFSLTQVKFDDDKESIIKQDDNFVSRLFEFKVNGKKVSGLANLPLNFEGERPVIILYRGYVPEEVYNHGEGTIRIGEALARFGYVTFAPDFLGYGTSEKPGILPLEDRFQTYITAVTLLKDIENNQIVWPKDWQKGIDVKKIGIWGHSNGGHIALSTLVITRAKHPTVLWAPVTKPFPFSVLVYTDDLPDQGKYLRDIISNFEKDYDVRKFSVSDYYSWIEAPIELHQGSLDEPIPQRWSDEFYRVMKTDLNKDIEYYVYPNADHNFNDFNSWQVAAVRTIRFFDEKLK